MNNWLIEWWMGCGELNWMFGYYQYHPLSHYWLQISSYKYNIILYIHCVYTQIDIINRYNESDIDEYGYKWREMKMKTHSSFTINPNHHQSITI